MKRAASAKLSESEVSRKSHCSESPKVPSPTDVDRDDAPHDETKVDTTGDLHDNGDSHSNGIPQAGSSELKMEQDVGEKVLILDFGAQYGKVIDRRVRECNVYSEMLPLNTPAKEITKRQFRFVLFVSIQLNSRVFRAIIISGGPNSVYVAEAAPKYDPEIFGLGIPIPWASATLINKHFGGEVSAHPFREDGQRNIALRTDCALFAGLQPEEQTLLTHGDSVTAIANETTKIYGVQFHPEVDLTTNGKAIFNNFLRNIAGLHATYTIQNREQLCIDHIREVVGDKKVLAMVSGGVDSTVCAALLHRALGKDSVVAIHIDNGRVSSGRGRIHSLSCRFMRQNESRDVVVSLNNLGLDVKSFNFIDDALASGCADTIKTHHNDTALVRELRNLGKVVEPLKDFHKDEVRELGRQLGLPEMIVNRHPFPGPGLAIRIICADRPYSTDTFMEITKKVKEAIDVFVRARHADVEIFSNLLPIRTVGVQGDRRTYSYAVALSTDVRPVPWELLDEISRLVPTIDPHINRCPSSSSPCSSTRSSGSTSCAAPSSTRSSFRPFITNDFMTGRNALPKRDIPEHVLDRIVQRITTEVCFISRVLIDLTSKPPGTTEWE
ncbi:Glutamine amidotransferase [Aphelenchoides fujianensis]|nr:Glutamine amidotransferase [Aphelenchoides fujianensis]